MSTRNFEYVARPADAKDWPRIWALLEPNIREGIWFPIPSDFTEAQARHFWCPESHAVFVGERDSEIVWTYYTCPIQLGGGSHIANAAYAVSQRYFGQGLGGDMVRHSLDSARAAGYRAMQYTTVLSSNQRAVSLYSRNGFEILGRVPDGYLHPLLGYVDTLIMYQRL
jgi:ribosomal protein S18 acetylase RimI-like enzyme